MGFLLFCFAGEKIDQDGQYKAANTPFPAFGVAGIAGSSQAEQDGKEGLLRIFLAEGESLVICAGKLLEAVLADDALRTIFTFIDERFFFLEIASALRAFQHIGIPPKIVLNSMVMHIF